MFVGTLNSREIDERNVEAERVLEKFITLFSQYPTPMDSSGNQKPSAEQAEQEPEDKPDPLVVRRNKLLDRILQWTTAKANASSELQPQQPDASPTTSENVTASRRETRKEADMDLD